MAFRRGRQHEATIDGQTIWLDSLTEETALRRFIEGYDFGNKWLRPKYGIKHKDKYYSPDFELAVDDLGNTARALVEVKQYRKNFTNDICDRMCAVAAHYNTQCLFLYAAVKDEWYQIDHFNSRIEPCEAPAPGKLNISDLRYPKRYLSSNWYGRHYYQSFSDAILTELRKIVFPSKPRRKKYSRRKLR
jgi:hypothetical protein